MAKLSREEVLKLAHLSRLQLSENEINSIQKDISSILEYVQLLQEVDTTGVKPTYQVSGLKNVTRADQIIDYKETPEQLLQNSPHRQDDQIKVQRML